MQSGASASNGAASFARIEVRTRDREAAERLAAEAYEAGAVGLEERDEAGGIALSVYAPQPRAEAVARALRERAGGSARVSGPEPVPAEDWAESWKAGLRAIDVSPRLRIRPSFVAAKPAPGQGRESGRAARRSRAKSGPPLGPAELVIDPGQAFGTGSHASTRLALEWIDRIAPRLAPAARILDVGCGTGVLALAALLLAPPGARGVAVDLDPQAAQAARANARRNALAARLDVVQGPLDALREAPCALVVANLLRTELLPLADAIARRTAAGGFAVLSGLLESERGEVERALARSGLAPRGVRGAADAAGERWIALLTAR
jgi:ribosomal protein L11 methyltransferase